MQMNSNPDILLSRADSLRENGKIFEAARAYSRITKSHPEHADSHHHLGALLTQMGLLDEAEIHLRHALTLSPAKAVTKHALALNLMAQGRYDESQPFYAARHEIPELIGVRPPAIPFPRWRGEPVFGKKIVIFPEGGFGDQIQFARFAPILVKQGASVTMLTRPALVRLFRDSFPTVSIIEAAGAVEFPDPDYWVMTADLPAEMRLTVQTVPGAPYLRAGLPEVWSEFRVGVKLKGNSAYLNDGRRSLKFEIAANLIRRLPGQVISLEPEDAGDFVDTATLINGLDAVVSTDTSIAHLAGALGRPCFTLLPGFATDWRWMTGGDRSPWYPMMRLYRSDMTGNWKPAMRGLVADLNQMALAKKCEPE